MHASSVCFASGAHGAAFTGATPARREAFTSYLFLLLDEDRAAASPLFRSRGVATMSSKKPPARVGGRDNDSGQFVPVKETYERPKSPTREHIPLPGYGDTARYY